MDHASARRTPTAHESGCKRLASESFPRGAPSERGPREKRKRRPTRMITLRRTIPFAMLTAALGAAGAAGCNDQKQVDTPPQPVMDAGVDAPPPPPIPPPTPVATPCDAVQTAALTTMFEGRKAAEAPGMQAEG